MEATAQKQKVTSAKDWKQKSFAVEFTVPSGNTCLVRPKSLNAYIKEGRLPETALKMAKKTMQSGKGPTEDEIYEAAEQDPALISGLMELMDSICVECIVEPKVHPVPDRCAVCEVTTKDHASTNPDHNFVEPERDEDVLYVDEIDFSDRAAVMAFVTGGVRDLESFRQPAEGSVEAKADVGDVQMPTEQPARPDVR